MKKLEYASLLLLLVLAAFLHFWNLGSGVIHDDEAIYAQVGRESLESGDLLVFTWKGNVGLGRGLVWLEKPPFFIWTVMAFGSAFGWTTFGVRLPSALAGMGTVLVTYLLVFHVTRSRWWGLLASFLLTLTVPFLEINRLGQTDSLLTFLFVLSLYGFVRALSEPRWYYLFFVAAALAVMTKSAVGLLPIFVAGIYLLLHRNFHVFANPFFLRGVALFFLIVAPWHLYIFLTAPHAALSQYVSYHVLERATRTVDGHAGGWTFYIDFLRVFYPASSLLLLACTYVLARWKSVSEGGRVMLFGAIVPFVLFSVSATKIFWYLHPLYPIFSAVIAIAIADTAGRFAKLRWYLMPTVVFLVLFAVSVSSAYAWKRISTPDPRGEDEAAIGRMLRDGQALPVYMLSCCGISHTALFYADKIIYRIGALAEAKKSLFYLIPDPRKDAAISDPEESKYLFTPEYESETFSFFKVQKK